MWVRFGLRVLELRVHTSHQSLRNVSRVKLSNAGEINLRSEWCCFRWLQSRMEDDAEDSEDEEHQTPGQKGATTLSVACSDGM